MNRATTQIEPGGHVVVIGAGIGGLVAGVLLRASGLAVTILERHDWVGGKLRVVGSHAGPVDAGPTVLTLRDVFDGVFRESGAALEDYVTLTREPCLARHFWPDGSQLDLWDDTDRSATEVARFAGRRAEREFRRFADDARSLYALFEAPMMRQAAPDMGQLTMRALTSPRHLPTLRPDLHLSDALEARFSDPRLRQLFGRYATYVGGMPDRVPALLQLIFQAEAAGIWRAEGGLATLAEGLARRFVETGGVLRMGTGVARILTDGAGVSGVALEDGSAIESNGVVFNGDPRALALGRLGHAARAVAPETEKAERSLSARVWSFAAKVEGATPLAHHNVFFASDPREEFAAIGAGKMPRDPTIYVCAQDRGTGLPVPVGPERFEIILNAAPATTGARMEDEVEACRQTTFDRLASFGLRFRDKPPDTALTTPAMFEAMHPGSAGALYGTSPHGMMSSLKRPRARTSLPGLMLAGGGVHPGPGLPMAALSGRFAAEAMIADLVST